MPGGPRRVRQRGRGLALRHGRPAGLRARLQVLHARLRSRRRRLVLRPARLPRRLRPRHHQEPHSAVASSTPAPASSAESHSCTNLGLAFAHDDNHTRARELYAQACTAGDGRRGCFELGWEYERTTPPEDAARAIGYYRRGCELGSIAVRINLSIRLEPSDAAGAAKALAAVCKLPPPDPIEESRPRRAVRQSLPGSRLGYGARSHQHEELADGQEGIGRLSRHGDHRHEHEVVGRRGASRRGDRRSSRCATCASPRITKLDMKIEDGKVVAYRARVSLSFKYDPA